MPAFIDLTGQIFTRLIVLAQAEKDNSGLTRWLCKCACGKEVSLGDYQGDAIRDIVGGLGGMNSIWTDPANITGAFELATTGFRSKDPYANADRTYGALFKASNVVPTAEENRMANIAVNLCIKAYDTVTNEENIDVKNLQKDVDRNVTAIAGKVNYTDFVQNISGGFINSKLPLGLTMKTGIVTTFGVNISVTFEEAFDNECVFAAFFPQYNSSSALASQYWFVTSKNAGGLVAAAIASYAGGTPWIAFGY